MSSDPRFHTLYEDWKARLQRLEGLAQWTGDYHAVEIQLLKYLLHRYRDSAEGTRPARFPLKSKLYINHRALVVFHHLADGRFPTMASAEQTRDHVKAVLERMASQQATKQEAAELELPWPGEAPPTDRAVDELRMKLCDGDPLVRVRAVVELGETGTLDDIGLLSDLLALPPSPDEHPRERPALVHALQRLAGMKSDKFDMTGIERSPPSEIDNADPDSPSLVPPNIYADPTFGLESQGSQSDWVCPQCAAKIPGNFARCWNCGTSADGVEDPTFVQPDDD